MIAVIQEPAESLRADDFLCRRRFGRSYTFAGNQLVVQALVGTFLVGVMFVFAEQMPQVSLPEDAEVIEAFRFDAEHEAFGVGVLIRLPQCRGLIATPRSSRMAFELGHELAIAVANQMIGSKGSAAKNSVSL